MTHSLIRADRGTHAKIVALALIAGILVVVGGIHAHVSRPGTNSAEIDQPVLKAGQPAAMTKRDGSMVR